MDEQVSSFAIDDGDGEQIASSYSFELILTRADGTQQKLTRFDQPMASRCS